MLRCLTDQKVYSNKQSICLPFKVQYWEAFSESFTYYIPNEFHKRYLQISIKNEIIFFENILLSIWLVFFFSCAVRNILKCVYCTHLTCFYNAFAFSFVNKFDKFFKYYVRWLMISNDFYFHHITFRQNEEKMNSNYNNFNSKAKAIKYFEKFNEILCNE